MFTPADPFPYKETMIRTLTEMNKFRQDKLAPTTRMLSIMLYIERNLDQAVFKRRFGDSGIQMYAHKSKAHKDFVRSFPERIGIIKNWDPETYEFYQSIAFGTAPYENNFDEFYTELIKALKKVADKEDLEDLLDLFKNKRDLDI